MNVVACYRHLVLYSLFGVLMAGCTKPDEPVITNTQTSSAPVVQEQQTPLDDHYQRVLEAKVLRDQAIESVQRPADQIAEDELRDAEGLMRLVRVEPDALVATLEPAGDYIKNLLAGLLGSGDNVIRFSDLSGNTGQKFDLVVAYLAFSSLGADEATRANWFRQIEQALVAEGELLLIDYAADPDMSWEDAAQLGRVNQDSVLDWARTSGLDLTEIRVLVDSPTDERSEEATGRLSELDQLALRFVRRPG